MAEASKADSSASLSRRKMNADELLLVQETKSSVNRGAHRGASKADMILAQDDMSSMGSSQYSKMQVKDMDPKTQMRVNEVSLMHVNLKPDGSYSDMWSNVSGVVNDLKNVDPIVDSKLKRAIGNFYQAGNYCEFLIGLYEVQQNPVVDFKRLCGDGFVMDSFYRQVRDGLSEGKFVAETDDWTKEEDTEDVFNCYSSDEEEEAAPNKDDEYLHPTGYLQLSYDENLVNMWIEKIDTRHIEDKNHMMGLMAHNAEHPDNLKIIINKGGDDLIRLCKNVLESENNSAAVPLVRNTSCLVKQLAENTDMWTADCVDAMIEAMTFWVPGPDNGRKEQAKTGAFEVTESRETVRNLVDTLLIMKNKGVDVAQMEKCMATRSDKTTAALAAYLEDQEESEAINFVKSLFPQS